MANLAAVWSYIQSELTAGQPVGPFTAEACQHVHTSPIWLVLKGHTTGKWRMIVDLSSPMGCSVNDGINPDMFVEVHFVG